ncbi:MAG: hypothetical protein EPO32_05595 [Anaerolineae bacterium]|nr:MAG: hypothetical protein EPO32_05595 [Anaerolineae bacterium]
MNEHEPLNAAVPSHAEVSPLDAPALWLTLAAFEQALAAVTLAYKLLAGRIAKQYPSPIYGRGGRR